LLLRSTTSANTTLLPRGIYNSGLVTPPTTFNDSDVATLRRMVIIKRQVNRTRSGNKNMIKHLNAISIWNANQIRATGMEPNTQNVSWLTCALMSSGKWKYKFLSCSKLAQMEKSAKLSFRGIVGRNPAIGI